MYEYICGTLTELDPAQAVVEAAGVGYLLIISLETYSRLESLRGSQVRLYTHYSVRDDARVLYGFADREERELFRQLISVSGVGGGTARMILSTYSPEQLVGIISADNARLLKNVKGLGLKTAQKIIVELKDKVSLPGAVSAASMGENSQVYSEAVSALCMLGFAKASSEKAVSEALRSIPTGSVEEVIRQALKGL